MYGFVLFACFRERVHKVLLNYKVDESYRSKQKNRKHSECLQSSWGKKPNDVYKYSV